jgi:hypothetical protein
MRTRLVAVVGPAVLTLGLAVAVTQTVGGDSPASGEHPDAGRPAAAPQLSVTYGEAQAAHERGVAGAYAGALAQAQLEAYWKAMDDARQAAAEAARRSSSSGSGSGGGGGSLAAIRECESQGDYGAVSADGTYRGAYQFDQSAWESVGGTGDPAAAPPEEQDARAAALYSQRGSSPWPNC